MRALLLCLALSSSTFAQRWSGYLHEDERVVGHARLIDEGHKVFGALRIYDDDRFDFVSMERKEKLYTGEWRGSWTLNPWEPVISWWVELLGYRHWLFQMCGRTFYGVLRTDN